MGKKLCPICNKKSLVICATINGEDTDFSWDCLEGDHCFENWQEVLRYRKHKKGETNG